MGFDGILVADLGMFSLVQEYAPEIPIHISTQANNVNYQSAKKWYELGAKRVVLAREMSFSEMREIREKTPPDLELEAFVHGAMCISYSGRCLLSNYMTRRDANQGACAHPCRWNYSLMEQTRPGQYMDIYENERGSFIFNSKDLCLIEHIPELVESGISSFKIEGRVKTSYYAATIVKAYREEIDRYFADPKNYTFDKNQLLELCKVSHRPYTTGFYFGEPGQHYAEASYFTSADVAAVVESCEADGSAVLTQRNKFCLGDELELLSPSAAPVRFTVNAMQNAEGEEIADTRHAMMEIHMRLPAAAPPGSILRKRR